MSDKLEKAIENSNKLRPRTKELYLQHVRAFLLHLGAKARTPNAVLAWRDDMVARKMRPQSINVALNALRFAAQAANAKFFTAQIERLPIPENTDDDDAQALSWKQGQRLVAACGGQLPRDLRDRAMIVLGLRTGMLRFSMCALKIKDLDGSAAPTLTFTKKGGDRHKIHLDATTYEALRPWIDWLDSQGEGAGLLFRSLGRPRVTRDGDVVEIGNKLTPDGLYRILQQRGNTVGLTDLSPYVFRTTFKRWAKRVGALPPQIAMVTGHRSDAEGELPEPGAVAANLLLPNFDVPNLRGEE